MNLLGLIFFFFLSWKIYYFEKLNSDPTRQISNMYVRVHVYSSMYYENNNE